MALKTLTFNLRGIAPLIMHSDRTVNTLDPLTVAMKEITSKRKKTDEDLAQLADLEWQAGLYTDSDGRVCIPSENIDKMLEKSAARVKRKDDFKAGCIALGPFPLIFKDSGKSVDELMRDDNYRYAKSKCVGQKRVMRMRPIFREWCVKIVIQFDDSVLNTKDVRECVERGGVLIGLCDERPRYGRFVVE